MDRYTKVYKGIRISKFEFVAKINSFPTDLFTRNIFSTISRYLDWVMAFFLLHPKFFKIQFVAQLFPVLLSFHTTYLHLFVFNLVNIIFKASSPPFSKKNSEHNVYIFNQNIFDLKMLFFIYYKIKHN